MVRSAGEAVFVLPKFKPGAMAIFLVAVVVTALLADRPLADRLLLHPGEVLQGRGLWQPITANFLFPDGRIGWVFATFVVQWSIGGQLEAFWGTRRYVVLMLAAGIGGYLLATVTAIWVARVAEQPVGGASGIDLAAVAAYGVVFSKRTERLFAFIPLRPRTIAALFVVLAFVAPLVRQEPWPIVLPWAGAVSIALIVTLQPWRRMGDSGKLHKRRRRAKPRHLKVVKPDRDLLN